MSQYSYSYPNGQVGQCGTYATGDIMSVENPLNAQVDTIDINGGTTDGDYTLQAVLPGSGFTVSATFTASGNTANEIAAGLAAAINADPDFRGVASSAYSAGDSFPLTFLKAGVAFTVTFSSDPSSGALVTAVTAAGYTQVAPGIILQADGSGGFTTTYSDAALAFGVTLRNADLVQPLQSNPAAATGYDGPSEMGVLRRGEVYVQVASGVSVDKGDKAYFNGTAGTWSNVTTGSHVLVEGAQWATSGSGVQRVFVNLPSET